MGRQEALGGRVPVVHIGWSRAGSTWLQEDVFPRMRAVASTWSDPVWRNLSWKLGTAEDDRYYEHTLQAFVDEFAKRHPSSALVYTQNEISGYYLDPRRTMWRSADRVKRLFPEARILIVTRRQDRILRALYGLYVRTGGYHSFGDLLNDRPIEGWNWDRSYLEFDALAARYAELYGADNVNVLPHELALTDPDRFLGDLGAFCGANGYDEYDLLTQRRVNPSFSPPAAFALRTWNRLFVSSHFNPTPRVGARSAGLRFHQLLNEKIDPLLRRFDWRWPSKDDRRRLDELSASYAESNLRLQELCAYRLGDLGYALPVTPDRPAESAHPAAQLA